MNVQRVDLCHLIIGVVKSCLLVTAGSSRMTLHSAIHSRLPVFMQHLNLSMPERLLITLVHCSGGIHETTTYHISHRRIAHLQNVSSSSVRPDVSGNMK